MIGPLAHGVGTVYESPIPLSLYVLGAAATVLVSFVVRAVAGGAPRPLGARLVAAPRAAAAVAGVLKWGAFALLIVLVLSGITVRGDGLALAALLFWVGLVVGVVLLSAVLSGSWDAADPWATAEELYRIEGDRGMAAPPPWLGPGLLYLLFWFELVSGVGFHDVWVVLAVLLYTLYSLVARERFGPRYGDADPFAILFGFAGRVAPFRLRPAGFEVRSPIAGLDEQRPMPLPLYASVFVLLGATTLDNLRETVGWSEFVNAAGLDAVPVMVLDSVALAVFGVLFYLPFLSAVLLASRRSRAPRRDAGRLFGWSLIPIGIAYVLAHNAPLVMTGVPAVVRALADPFGLGWDVASLSDAFSGFIPSPRAVWFSEIALIVGGHVLGVLAAHRAAYRIQPQHGAAVRSQYALTVLMSVYTIATLWLLAQPLVA